jgi:predicted kinase
MAQPTLYLMLGYPGAGKTTTAEIIAHLTNAIHLASDQIRLNMYPRPDFTPEEHQALYRAIDTKTEQLLTGGHDVIYDANLNQYIHRQQKYDICHRTNARPVLIWIQTSKDVAKYRATEQPQREARRPFGNLDISTFERLVHQVQPPRPEEQAFTITLDGTKITKDYVAEALRSFTFK